MVRETPNWVKSLAVAVLLLCTRVPVSAQSGGSLTGKLTDLHSSPLAGATVVLRNQSTGAETRTITAKDGVYRDPPQPLRPLFIIGFTPRDLACLRFIDRFFNAGWRDDLYFRQRRDAVVAGVSGWCGTVPPVHTCISTVWTLPILPWRTSSRANW